MSSQCGRSRVSMREAQLITNIGLIQEKTINTNVKLIKERHYQHHNWANKGETQPITNIRLMQGSIINDGLIEEKHNK